MFGGGGDDDAQQWRNAYNDERVNTEVRVAHANDTGNQREIGYLRREVERLRAALEAANQSSRTATKEREQLIRSEASACAARDILKEKLSEAEGKLAAALASLAEESARGATLLRERDRAAARCASLEAECDCERARAEGLSSELATACASLKAAEARGDAASARANTAEGALANALGRCAALELRVTHTETEADVLLQSSTAAARAVAETQLVELREEASARPPPPPALRRESSPPLPLDARQRSVSPPRPRAPPPPPVDTALEAMTGAQLRTLMARRGVAASDAADETRPPHDADAVASRVRARRAAAPDADVQARAKPPVRARARPPPLSETERDDIIEEALTLGAPESAVYKGDVKLKKPRADATLQGVLKKWRADARYNEKVASKEDELEVTLEECTTLTDASIFAPEFAPRRVVRKYAGYDDFYDAVDKSAELEAHVVDVHARSVERFRAFFDVGVKAEKILVAGCDRTQEEFRTRDLGSSRTRRGRTWLGAARSG